MIYRIAAIHCSGHQEDAGDVFQEVFLALLRSKKSFQTEEHLKAWLIRVTLNQCKKKYHSRKRYIPMAQEELTRYLEQTQVIGEEPGKLLMALCHLPTKYRKVLELFYLEEFQTKEIAGILHLSESAVRKRLQRGRQMLLERRSSL